MESMYKDCCFFTVLEEPVSSTLLFPDEFVRKYGEMLPEEAFLMTEQKYGRCWKVKVAQLDNGRFCFADGWPHFVDGNPQIRPSDYAVFQLVDASTFHVTVFEKNGLKKPLTFSPPPPPQDMENNRSRRKNPIACSQISRRSRSYFERGVEVDGVKSFTIPSLNKFHFHYLNIPVRFSVGTGIAYKSKITLKNEEGDSWEVLVRAREKGGGGARNHLGGLDWQEFWIENCLTPGNRLTFSIVGDDFGTLHVSREGFILPTLPKKLTGRPRKHF